MPPGHGFHLPPEPHTPTQQHTSAPKAAKLGAGAEKAPQTCVQCEQRACRDHVQVTETIRRTSAYSRGAETPANTSPPHTSPPTPPPHPARRPSPHSPPGTLHEGALFPLRRPWAFPSLRGRCGTPVPPRGGGLGVKEPGPSQWSLKSQCLFSDDNHQLGGQGAGRESVKSHRQDQSERDTLCTVRVALDVVPSRNVVVWTG